MADRLYRLTQSPDPVGFAREQGIFYRDGLVRVEVEMIDPTGNIPPQHNAQVESRLDRLVQALVPVGQLCALSDDPAVRLVKVPDFIRPMGR